MKSKIKLLLVINPIAGGSEKNNLLKDVQELVNTKSVSLSTYETTGDNDEVQLRQILISTSIDKVLVAGGDGTIQLVAKAIGNLNIAIAIIPAGSANGLASNFKIPDTLEAQVNIALGNDFIMMDLLSVNDRLCLHIADIGINAELIKNYDNSTFRGKLGYALHTIPTLIQSDLPYLFRLEVNQEKIEVEGIMIAIANANQFGTGAIINPDGKIDDGIFEVLVFKKLDFLNILKTLNQNSEPDADFVQSYATKQVNIYCEKKVSLQVDGEYISDVNDVEAHVHPYTLKVMIPSAKTL